MSAHVRRGTTFLVGCGSNEPAGREATLKVQETSFIAAGGMEVEQFLHGPWQVPDSESVGFVLVAKGPGHGGMLDLIRAVRELGAYGVADTPEGDHGLETASELALIVLEVGEFPSPFLNIIPPYLYAYYSSVKRGHNPDALRYLGPSTGRRGESSSCPGPAVFPRLKGRTRRGPAPGCPPRPWPSARNSWP